MDNKRDASKYNDPMNDPNPNKVKTSSDTNDDPREGGESKAQEGQGVVNTEEQQQVVNEQGLEEYIDNVNNNTRLANENPVQGGKGMTM